MGESGRNLTRREFDAVIRRAAELAGSDPETGEGSVSEGELLRIAGEVGLPDTHVRRALAEVRSGEVGGTALDRFFGPALVRASRVVPGTPDKIGTELDEFLVATQLLQPVRRTDTLLQYRPAVDWTSQLARAASLSSRKYYIASAKSVEVTLERVDEGHTFVEFLVDPGTRNEQLAGAVFGGGASGAASGITLGVIIASSGPLLLGVGAGVVIGAGVWTGVAALVARQHREKVHDVRDEVEGVLDSLERGVSLVARQHREKVHDVRDEVEGVLDSLERGVSLEPPPPSWRRWVRRHFHGVARDLRGRDEE